MKTCGCCKVSLTLDSFSPLRTGKGGLNPFCKPCRNADNRARRLADPEKFKEWDKKSYVKNLDTKKASISKYYQSNKDRIKENMRVRYEENKEHILSQKKIYNQLNREKIRYWNGTRRAQLKLAVPPWADKQKIREIYKLASRLWDETGEPHHVDHIIPIKGKAVSGLHVHDNLQVIKAVDNLRKGNKFEA
jgi:hypothetical protein